MDIFGGHSNNYTYNFMKNRMEVFKKSKYREKSHDSKLLLLIIYLSEMM